MSDLHQPDRLSIRSAENGVDHEVREDGEDMGGIVVDHSGGVGGNLDGVEDADEM